MAEPQTNEAGAAQRVFCPSCGTPNPRANRFCGSCGHPLPELVATPALSPPSAPVAPTSVNITTPPPRVEVPSDVAMLMTRGFAVDAQTVVRPAPPTVITTPTTPVAPKPPAAPPKPPADVAVPSDPILRERERERLISEATRLRIKGHVTEARQTLERALAYVEGARPQTVAPLYEQIGDLLDDEERTDEAAAAYQKAIEIDPKRASAEKKYASLTLRVASQNPENQLSDTLIHGDSLIGLLQTGGLRPATGKRNAGVAMLMSMLIPGFGQFYNGQVPKGVAVLAVFLVSLLLVAVLPDGAAVFGTIASLFALRPTSGAQSIPPLVWAITFVGIGAWLYAIVDAPFFAAKTGSDAVGPARSNIDKTGWEV